jgi:hypothetical protein
MADPVQPSLLLCPSLLEGPLLVFLHFRKTLKNSCEWHATLAKNVTLARKKNFLLVFFITPTHTLMTQ